MSDWKFAKDEVVSDRDGQWWHIMDRYESIDSDRRKYHIADATHTEYKDVVAEDMEDFGDWSSEGWSCICKPAAKRGVRINGVLAEPSSIPYWRGNECKHDYPCGSCGAPCERVDILMTRTHVLTECRECGEWYMEKL